MAAQGPLALLLLLLATCFVSSWATPLDDYINMPDDSYKYDVITSFRGEGYTVQVINMTSQTWLTTEVSSKPVWVHWLLVCVPDHLDKSTDIGSIYIDGGSDTNSIPNTISSVTEIVCVSSNQITAELRQIPNEPVYMGNETYTRTEDGIVAWTWEAFLQDTSRVYFPLELPMTKAAVRALDTIQDLPNRIDGFQQINRFAVAGASKRGWTTWLTGAVDTRVIAMVPIVIDILNMTANLNHMWEAYGFWTFALQDYVNAGVTHYLNKPQMTALEAIIDPITYIDRFEKIPIYAICTTGDEFFLPDSPQFFWSQLPGNNNWLRMVQNAEHSLIGHAPDLAYTISVFIRSVVDNLALPQISWDISDDTGAISVVTDTEPVKLRVWHARDHKTRDFRLVVCADLSNISCIHPILWDYNEVQPVKSSNGEYTYVAQLENNEPGYLGFYIELHYDMFKDERDNLKLTTEVSILPKTLPFPSCGQNC
eukprot:TRINITY_DN1478_c0_g1_i1.p1 TRINITY_DN1478_c0_g1~~TRINITY_DN1478_c0_g1_i1.p1  ORF type:complete len:481 (+),score=186.58 TRINITY_DN1478_c0_g1_i1:121-1563(+)